MEKTGRQKISKNRNKGKPARCANCGGEGAYRVTYEDMYSKLTVTLCEECEMLGYGQLKLQSQLDW
jgi:excinuclease UvrABC ATPase subunit